MAARPERRDQVPASKAELDLADPFVATAHLSQAEYIGQGMTCVVFKVISEQHGVVALKVPRSKIFSNANDPNLVSRDLLAQELRIYELLVNTGVPVPRAHELLEVDGHPAMLCEYVESDNTHAGPQELGRVTALLHNVQLPEDWGVHLVAEEGTDAITALRQRMWRRFRTLVEHEPHLAHLIPPENTLQRLSIQLKRFPACLNHMDLDDVNLRVRDGRITALIDWGNAMVGPAAMDIYRIVELGSFGDAFLEAYKGTRSLPSLTAEEKTFLRLDSALMLALVFALEAPDPEAYRPALGRVEVLAAALSTPELASQ